MFSKISLSKVTTLTFPSKFKLMDFPARELARLAIPVSVKVPGVSLCKVPDKAFEAGCVPVIFWLVASCLMEFIVMVPAVAEGVVITETAADDEVAFTVLKKEALRKLVGESTSKYEL